MKESVLFLFVVFATNILQAITGFAGTMLAMPGSILLIGLLPSKAVLNVIGLLASLWIAVRYVRSIDWREFLKITCYMVLGIVVGIQVSVLASQDVLIKIYGVIIIIVAIIKIVSPSRYKLPEWVMRGLLVTAGLIHGLFISGGSLLVIYAVDKLRKKETFRATLSAVWVVLNTGLLVSHIQLGYFTYSTMRLTAMAIPALGMGVIVGNKIYQHIKPEVFLKLTYVLLIISGGLILK